MKFCKKCGKDLDEHLFCTSCNLDYKPLDSQRHRLGYVSRPLKDYSKGVKVSFGAIFAVILLDIYLVVDVIRMDPGYGGLAALAAQAMFIPIILGIVLLHMKFKNREDENYYRKTQNIPTIPSFNDKFKGLAPKYKKIFYAALIILLIAIAGMVTTYNFQDNETNIVRVGQSGFEEQLEWAYINNGSIYTIELDTMNTQYIVKRYADNTFEEVSRFSIGFDAIEERRYLENYIFSFSKNYETGENKFNIADTLIAKSDNYVISLLENDNFENRYQIQIYPFIYNDLPGAYIYKIRYGYNDETGRLEYQDSKMNLAYNNSTSIINTTNYIFDILVNNNQIYTLSYVNNNVVVDQYDTRPDEIITNSSITTQTISRDEISIEDPVDDARGLSLSMQNNNMYILANNFIYETSSNRKINIDDLGAGFISSGNYNYLLGATIGNEEVLVIGYDTHLSFYNQDLVEIAMAHSPSTNYETRTEMSNLLYFNGEIVTINHSSSELYFWPTDLEALKQKANIVLFLTIVLIIITISDLIVMIWIGLKAHKNRVVVD